jgi:hypothetical protein
MTDPMILIRLYISENNIDIIDTDDVSIIENIEAQLEAGMIEPTQQLLDLLLNLE